MGIPTKYSHQRGRHISYHWYPQRQVSRCWNNLFTFIVISFNKSSLFEVATANQNAYTDELSTGRNGRPCVLIAKDRPLEQNQFRVPPTPVALWQTFCPTGYLWSHTDMTTDGGNSRTQARKYTPSFQQTFYAEAVEAAVRSTGFSCAVLHASSETTLLAEGLKEIT